MLLRAVDKNIHVSFGRQQSVRSGFTLKCLRGNGATIDATDRYVLPGWCDPHTHSVFAAPREEEFVMRIKGATYQDIAATGGGILNSALKLRAMSEDDLLFIGFDLQKDPHVIVPAYDDEAGVTAAFNLNLLKRINRELGANFDVDKFTHYANYRPVEASARSFLISREKQSVHIPVLNKTFEFDQWEAVFMEISQKYNPRMIEEMAAESGFEVKENFFDSRAYYCDSLWRTVKF